MSIVKFKELLILNPKVSIILPIYNVEKFLDTCIQSVINQTLEDIEIILVNDGSTDNSLSICYKYQKKDKRIKVINKTNGGVSSARNRGIQEANGTYIGFVDSDDWIEPEMYEKLYAKIDDINADVGMCNYVVDNNGKSTLKALDTDAEVFEKKDIVDYLIPNMIGQDSFNSKQQNVMGSVCRLIIKRKFIVDNKLMFKTDLALMEDLIFCVEAFLKVDILSLVNGGYYHYVTNDNSALTSYRPNTIEERLEIHDYLRNLFEKESIYNKYRLRMNYRYIKMFIISISNEMRNDNPKSSKEKLNTIKILCQNKKLKELLRELDVKRYSTTTKILLNAIENERNYFLYLYYKIKNKM